MNSNSAITQIGAAVVVDLSRLSAATVAVALPTQLQHWAKSPDVYALILQRAQAAHPVSAAPLSTGQCAELLKLVWRLDCFPKPLVSLLDAPLTPLDIALTTFGTHRVGGEKYSLALPVPSDLASLPGAGIARALARLPNALGAELASTGRVIGAAEAYAADLLTHCIPSSEFPRIVGALADGQPVDPLLDGAHVELAASPSVMTSDTGQASRLADAMSTLIARARAMDVRESLIATYRLAVAVRDPDIGASVKIDLAEPPKSGDLQLPLRSEIENGRF